jgi:hypothetical protein
MRGGGGGVSTQPAQHDAVTNRRDAWLRTPGAEEFIYYTPPAECCAMGWCRKRSERQPHLAPKQDG